jgi:hypothetical protein
MWQQRSTYRFLVGKPEGKEAQDVGMDGIILK